jgi:hypothetical protein
MRLATTRGIEPRFDELTARCPPPERPGGQLLLPSSPFEFVFMASSFLLVGGFVLKYAHQDSNLDSPANPAGAFSGV